MLGLPIIVGALVDKLGYSPTAAGYVASCDLAGLCIGSAVTSTLAHRLHWRRYVGAAVVACIALNVVCASAAGFWVLAILRLAAGSAAGAVYAAALLLLSRGDDSVRSFSLMIFASVVANAIVLAVFPALGQRWGPAALFIAIALVLSVTFPLVRRLPDASSRGQGPSPDSRIRGTIPALSALCLVAVAFFYVAIGSYWTYAERMGLESGLPSSAVHALLSIGVLLSAAGCLLAFWLSQRVGQSRPLLVALGLLAVTLMLHAAIPQPSMYIITLGVLQLSWNFVDIFQLGTLAVIDPTGRAGALVPAAQGAALAIGPTAGGTMLALGQGYAGVLVLGGAAAMLATISYAIVHVKHRRSAKGRSSVF
jgi:predicted MFS family arabinose efflux permease